MQPEVLPRQTELNGHRVEHAPEGDEVDPQAAAAAASVDEDKPADEESHCARLLRHALFALWEWASTGTLTHLRPARRMACCLSQPGSHTPAAAGAQVRAVQHACASSAVHCARQRRRVAVRAAPLGFVVGH